MLRSLSRLCLLLVLPAILYCQIPQDAPPVARKFLTLFDQLRAAEAQKAAGKPEHVAFDMTDAEVVEYFKYSLHATPRPGLDSFLAKFFPNNYVSTYIVIDFDAVEKWRPGTVPTLLKPVLSGKKSVLIDYRIDAKDYRMTFSVEKARFQDIAIPAFVVQKVIEIVASRQPEHYDTSKPIPIPFGLKNLWTTQGAMHGQN